MSYLELRPGPQQFSIGRALSTSFGVLKRNFIPMMTIGVVICILRMIVEVLISGMPPLAAESNASPFLSIVAAAIVMAPISYATFQDLRGNPLGLRHMISESAGRMWRVFATTLIFWIVIVTVALAIVAIFTFIAEPFVAIGVIIALAMAMAIGWFAVPAVQVVETIGFLAAFTRPRALANGRGWSILGLLIVYILMVFAIGTAVVLLVSLVVGALPEALLALPVALGALYTVFGAILPTVSYCLLRLEKEGVEIDEIVKIFD